MTQDQIVDPNITLEEITKQAEGGHAAYQYVLSKYFAAQDDQKTALDWMEKSSEGKFGPARVELGMWHLIGHIVDCNHEKGLSYLQECADEAFAPGLKVMATLHALGFAAEKNLEKGVDYLLQAADQEDPFSLRQIGFLCLGNAELKSIGETLIQRAASLNDPLSLVYLGKKEDEVKADEIPQNWEKWGQVRDFLLKLEDQPQVKAKDLSDTPKVKLFEKALSPVECLYLRETARPSLTPDVQLLGGNPDDPAFQVLQTNSAMILYPIIQDLMTVSISRKLAKMTGLPFEQAELLIIHHYAEGQEFKPHTDYMNPEFPQHAFSIQQSGQRVKSVFAYLNAGYEGGETAFYKNGLKVKGKEGDVIVLDNVNSIGLPDEDSEHAGLPVKKGEKWLATLWVRDKAQT